MKTEEGKKYRYIMLHVLHSMYLCAMRENGTAPAEFDQCCDNWASARSALLNEILTMEMVEEYRTAVLGDGKAAITRSILSRLIEREAAIARQEAEALPSPA